MNKLFLFCVLASVAVSQALIVPHTGNAYDDYIGYSGNVDLYWIPDPHNSISAEVPLDSEWSDEEKDVGVPSGIDERSGWDIRALYVNYDRFEDTMQFGVDCYGICGDADGDGDEASAGAIVSGNGGFDYPGLFSSETFSVLMDPVNNGEDTTFLPTVVAGWPAQIGQDLAFGLFEFNPSQKYQPSAGYMDPLTGSWSLESLYFPTDNNGVTDIEVTINDFILGTPGFTEVDVFEEDLAFKISVFAGSFEDDGVGEDVIPNNGFGVRVVWPGCPPDTCGYCPTNPNYGVGPDDCGFCADDPYYNTPRDECGFCVDHQQWAYGYLWTYGDSTDECDICLGPGLDSCGNCQDDFYYGAGECWDCNDVPFGDWIYDDCGDCRDPLDPEFDDTGCCEIESYKGLLVWEIDAILTYYNTRLTCDDLCILIDQLETSWDLAYTYTWSWSAYEPSPVDFISYCEYIVWWTWNCFEPFQAEWTYFIMELSA